MGATSDEGYSVAMTIDDDARESIEVKAAELRSKRSATDQLLMNAEVDGDREAFDRLVVLVERTRDAELARELDSIANLKNNAWARRVRAIQNIQTELDAEG